MAKTLKLRSVPVIGTGLMKSLFQKAQATPMVISMTKRLSQMS